MLTAGCVVVPAAGPSRRAEEGGVTRIDDRPFDGDIERQGKRGNELEIGRSTDGRIEERGGRPGRDYTRRVVRTTAQPPERPTARPSSEDVRARFAPVAPNYRTSFYHADPARLEEVLVLCRPRPGDVAVDVATGTGHVALALAGYLERVIGVDLTPAMLDEARDLASMREVENVDWVLGDAATLPFPDDSFDLYTVRSASHHFRDLETTLAEALRTLKPGGRACFIDCSPPAASRDILHEIELARDPSHVWSRTLNEWTALLELTGFEVESADVRERDWDFDAWMANMGVRADRAGELASRIESADEPAREQLRPRRRDGKLRFAYWHAQLRVRKPR
jgi:ubiquinone/menaquinone biosynthesis C-methylase UbiE